jgi:hypothetical protein
MQIFLKLTVDIDFSPQLFSAQVSEEKYRTLALLLSQAALVTHNFPLEAWVCEAFGLKENPDYPIAVIAAAADGIAVGDAFWLRADPVHLIMQRDTFSMAATHPLALSTLHAQALIHTLNQHFQADGLMFVIGQSGAWYLKVSHPFTQYLPVRTMLPHMVMGQNIHHFLPQGSMAKQWISLLNEIQMLLHTHDVNAARTQLGDVAVNSLWLSGGGVMPNDVGQNMPDTPETLVIAKHPFYAGLARVAHCSYQTLDGLPEMLMAQQATHIRLALAVNQGEDYVEAWCAMLHTMLNKKMIRELTLNIGCCDRTLVAKTYPRDAYKFWRQIKPISHFLNIQ